MYELRNTLKVQFVAFWRQHPPVSQVPLQRLPGGNRSSLALCEVLNLPKPFCRVRRSSCSKSRLFLLRMHRRFLFLPAVSRIRTSHFRHIFICRLLQGMVCHVYHITSSINFPEEHPPKTSVKCGLRASRSSPPAITKYAREYFST